MKRITLNNTELTVSPLCLGTVNYGTDTSAADARLQINAFLEAGGNFIDTAQIYGAWGKSAKEYSEYVLGQWLKENGHRQDLVLATKGAHPRWETMSVPRVNPKCIEEDLDNSLRLLGTDYIDLYFLHRDDVKMPVGDILECLEKARKAGKIRHYGCSNWSLERIKEAGDYSKKNGLEGFVCNQLMWSLADINFAGVPDPTFILMDRETYDYSAQTGLNTMAYMSIAKAYFTRRGAGEALPSSVTDCYSNASNDAIYEVMQKVEKEGQYNLMDMAFMYLMAVDAFPSIPIASFDTMAQLDVALKGLQKDIPYDLMKQLGALKKFKY